MKIKNIISAISMSAAVAVSSVAFGTVAKADSPLPTKAYICGEIGAVAVWSPDNVTAGSTVAEVNGDAQYEVSWAVNDIGTSSLTCLAVAIPNVTSDKYPDLSLKVNEVSIDGMLMDYSMSPNAVQLACYDPGKDPEARVYLFDSVKGTNIQDLAANTSITKNIKVTFTITGTGVTGTSNVTPTVGATTTALANDLTVTTTTSTSYYDPFAAVATTTTTVATTTGIVSTTTGDGGVAAVAIAGLALTGGAAVLSKVKFKKKDKK